MTRTEGGAAGLTPKGLDAFGLAMRAISNQRMNVCICNAKVGTLSVRTGIALGLHTDGALPGGFSPQTRDAQEQALVLHPTREWRPDDRQGNRLASGA